MLLPSSERGYHDDVDIKSRCLYRHVDDVVEVAKEKNIANFTEFLNQQDPQIQFRVETQVEDND